MIFMKYANLVVRKILKMYTFRELKMFFLRIFGSKEVGMPEDGMIKYGVDIPNTDKCPKCGKDLVNGVCPTCGSEPLEKKDDKKEDKDKSNKTTKRGNKEAAQLERDLKAAYESICRIIISASKYIINHNTLKKSVISTQIDKITKKQEKLFNLYKWRTPYIDDTHIFAKLPNAEIVDYALSFLVEKLDEIVEIAFMYDFKYSEGIEEIYNLLKDIEEYMNTVQENGAFDDYEIEFFDAIRFAALTATEHLDESAISGLDINILFEDVVDIMNDYLKADARKSNKEKNQSNVTRQIPLPVTTTSPKPKYVPTYCKEYPNVRGSSYLPSYYSQSWIQFEPYMVIKDKAHTIMTYGRVLTSAELNNALYKTNKV